MQAKKEKMNKQDTKIKQRVLRVSHRIVEVGVKQRVVALSSFVGRKARNSL